MICSFDCECSKHVIILEELYPERKIKIKIHLNHKLSLWERIKFAFGYKIEYSGLECLVLDEKDAKWLSKSVENCVEEMNFTHKNFI